MFRSQACFKVFYSGPAAGVYLKRRHPLLIFRITRQKWTDCNNFWWTESRGNLTSAEYKLVHLTSIMLPHYLVKNNSSDAACRIVDHTHNTPTVSCQSHPLITGKDCYKFGKLNIARHNTVDMDDMDTYFVMYRWSKYNIIVTVTHCRQSYFCISQGSAATSLLFYYKMSTWIYNFLMWNFLWILCAQPKRIEIGLFFAELFKI